MDPHEDALISIPCHFSGSHLENHVVSAACTYLENAILQALVVGDLCCYRGCPHVGNTVPTSV